MTIDYKQQLELLKKLQQIDTKLHRLESEQTEIPEQIDNAEMALSAVKTEFSNIKTQHDTASGEYKKLEEEVNHWKGQIKKREAKLYTISNNKEYQAITREIADIKRSNREREEKMLVFMEQIETLGPDLKKLEDRTKEKEDLYAKATQGTADRLKEIEKEMLEAGRDRPSLVNQIDKKILRKYEFINQRFPNSLAPVLNGICSGCHTKIPPQLFNEMLRHEDFKECPSCRRIIYIEEKKEEPEQTTDSKSQTTQS